MPITTFLRTESGYRVIYPHGAARTIPAAKIGVILSELGIIDTEAADILQLAPGKTLAHRSPVGRSSRAPVYLRWDGSDTLPQWTLDITF